MIAPLLLAALASQDCSISIARPDPLPPRWGYNLQAEGPWLASSSWGADGVFVHRRQPDDSLDLDFELPLRAWDLTVDSGRLAVVRANGSLTGGSNLRVFERNGPQAWDELQVQLPSGASPDQVAFDGLDLWVAGWDGGYTVWLLRQSAASPDWTVQASYTGLPFFPNDPGNMAADGGRLAFSNPDQERVWVYALDGALNLSMESMLTADVHEFGYHLALDGDTLAVATRGFGLPAAFVYERSTGGDWELSDQLRFDLPVSVLGTRLDLQGNRLALSGRIPQGRLLGLFERRPGSPRWLRNHERGYSAGESLENNWGYVALAGDSVYLGNFDSGPFLEGYSLSCIGQDRPALQRTVSSQPYASDDLPDSLVLHFADPELDALGATLLSVDYTGTVDQDYSLTVPACYLDSQFTANATYALRFRVHDSGLQLGMNPVPDGPVDGSLTGDVVHVDQNDEAVDIVVPFERAFGGDAVVPLGDRLAGPMPSMTVTGCFYNYFDWGIYACQGRADILGWACGWELLSFTATMTSSLVQLEVDANFAYSPLPVRGPGTQVSCGAEPNITGYSAKLSALGSIVGSEDRLYVHAEGVPPGTYAQIAFSPNLAATPFYGGGPSTMCLGSPRSTQGWGLQLANNAGHVTLPIPAAAWPMGGPPAPGTTWHSQLLFFDEDQDGNSFLNTTNLLSITFQ